MSGHNKWSKIKRKKEASDGAKSKVFSKHAALIAMEAKKAKGDLGSPGLIAAIERAKKDSMPKDNIDRAVQKGKALEGDALSEVLYEAFGPGGTAILITAVTDNPNRTTPEIRHTIKEAGYALGATGSASWAFTKTEGGYAPQNRMELTDEDGEKLAALIEALEEHDDVQEIYTTADGD
jgi:transcriptional/translational regulatory protein YebC/TACO1